MVTHEQTILPLKEQYKALLSQLVKAVELGQRDRAEATLEEIKDFGIETTYDLGSQPSNEDFPGIEQLDDFSGDIITEWQDIPVLAERVSRPITEEVPPVVEEAVVVGEAEKVITLEEVKASENPIQGLQKKRVEIASALLSLPEALRKSTDQYIALLNQLDSDPSLDITTVLAKFNLEEVDFNSVEVTLSVMEKDVFLWQQSNDDEKLEKTIDSESSKIAALSEKWAALKENTVFYSLLVETVLSYVEMYKLKSQVSTLDERSLAMLATGFTGIKAARTILRDKFEIASLSLKPNNKNLLTTQVSKYEKLYQSLEQLEIDTKQAVLEKKLDDLRNIHDVSSQKAALEAEFSRGYASLTESQTAITQRVDRLEVKLKEFVQYVEAYAIDDDSKNEYTRLDLADITNKVAERIKTLKIQEKINTAYPEISKIDSIVAGLNTYKSISDLTKNLQELQNYQSTFDLVDGLNQPELILYTNTVKSEFEDLKKKIQDKINRLESEEQKRISAPAYRDREQVRKSIEAFFIQRGIPERKEGQPIGEYLNIVHENMLRIAIATTWNSKLDEADSKDQRTADYDVEPFRGPVREFSLNGSQFIYDNRPDQRVKTYEAFFDQFFLYFDDHDEQDEVKEFSVLLKEKFKEVSIWHNRSVVRRNNENPAGPDAALAGLSKLYSEGYTPKIENLFKLRPDATESEKRFVDGIKFSMGLWSLVALKRKQRIKIWDKVDPRHKKYFESSTSTTKIPCSLKKQYDCIPRYIGTDDMRKDLIETIITDLQGSGLTLSEAQMAYHIGECFRIGGGQEAFADAQYSTADRDSKKEKGEKNVGVQAQEGEPKSANIGLYIESAWGNTSRPDFVVPYKDYLVHGYMPFAIAAQFNHTMAEDVSGFGDRRATLAELLAIKDGVDHIDWKSSSTNPDKTVYQAASQATNFLWPGSKISSAKEPKHSLVVAVDQVPLQTLGPLDREEEYSRVSALFGFQGKFQKLLIEKTDILSMKPKVEELEVSGFHSESVPISGDRKQRLKTLYKDSRDYWINAYKNDASRYPMDTMRMMEYIFSRDDTLESHNGYVNSKIGGIIERARAVPISDKGKWLNSTFTPWLQGYLTFDLLLRSNFFLFSPDYRNISALSSDESASKLYDLLDYANYENYVVKTISGTQTLNVAQLMFIINQAKQLVGLIPEETEKIMASGYRLFDDTNKDIELISPEILGHARNGDKLFTQPDLLRLAQEFDMGTGYHYTHATDGSGRRFWQLKRKPRQKPTRQFIVDRVTLLQLLFDKKSLSLRG